MTQESDFVLASLSAIRHTSSASSVVSTVYCFSAINAVSFGVLFLFRFLQLSGASRETSPSNAETDVLLFRNFRSYGIAGLVLPRVENSAEVFGLGA